MGRKPKATVDILANLEIMSRDMSLPVAVREEAAKEYVRLKAKDKTVAAPAPVAAPVMLEADVIAAFRKIGEVPAPVAKPEPPKIEPKPVEPVRPVDPEPVEREQGSIWTVAGRRMVYLGWDAKDQMRLLSDERPIGVGIPEVIRVSEDRLTNKKYAAPLRGRGNFETPEECRARLRRERVRAQSEWNTAMGVGQFGGDPDE